MIRRAPRPTANYTVVSNGVLLDERLSYRARGLLVAILARPDNWSVRSDALARQGAEGRQAVRTALNELREAGYLHTWKERNADGTFITEQVVFEVPTSEEDAKHLLRPGTGNRTPVDRTPVDRTPDSWAPLQEPRASTESNENTLAHASVSTSDDTGPSFEHWWSAYPRKVGKGAALKRWRAMSSKQRAEALDALPDHVRHWQTQRTEVRFIPHPATWLSQARWHDVLATEQRHPSAPSAVLYAAERLRQAQERERTPERPTLMLGPIDSEMWED
jgi:hypothetical protein